MEIVAAAGIASGINAIQSSNFPPSQLNQTLFFSSQASSMV
jgi:hypothetical protein